MSVIINSIDGGLKTEGSLPQNQDSTYDQLKQVRTVAGAIGCYDAADLLTTMIEKIDNKS
jgi:hypothetical protein